MFLFKPKKVVVDCFTMDPFVHEYASISPATKYYPEWWKKLPVEYKLKGDSSNNMKRCIGFTNLYQQSFIMPMWGNVIVNLSNNQEKLFTVEFDFQIDNNKAFGHHPSIQYSGFVSDDYTHIKLNTPWHFKTRSDIKFLLMDSIWSKSELNNYHILPGSVDFRYQPSNHINLMAKYGKEDSQIQFNVGDPLAMIQPITESEVDFKCHLVTKKEYLVLFPQPRLKFYQSKLYSTFKKFIKKHEERQESKCPFGFKK